MRNANLIAAMALAIVADSGLPDAHRLVLRDQGSGNNRRRTPPRTDTALAAEIAEWNAAVERRKAEKRQRRTDGAKGPSNG